MPDALVTGLLWFSAIGCGLLGGLYFAFSAFIMTAFARIDRASATAAMNAINAAILRSLFMPIFLGTTLAGLVLALAALLDWSDPAAPAMLAGGIAHVAGMFAVTMLFNVPLNNALAVADAPSADATWSRYLRTWTAWNHARTLSSLAACALFIHAIAAREAVLAALQ
jgi:uncharacterized membrane protein